MFTCRVICFLQVHVGRVSGRVRRNLRGPRAGPPRQASATRSARPRAESRARDTPGRVGAEAPLGPPSDNPPGGALVPRPGFRARPCPPPVAGAARDPRSHPRPVTRAGGTPAAPRAHTPPNRPGPTCVGRAGGRRRHLPEGHLLPVPGRFGLRGPRGPRRIPAGGGTAPPPGPRGLGLTVSAENFCAGACGSSPASSGSQQSRGSSMVTGRGAGGALGPGGRGRRSEQRPRPARWHGGRGAGGGAARGPLPQRSGRPGLNQLPSRHPAVLRVLCGFPGSCQITAELPGSSSRPPARPPPSPPPPSPTPRARRRAPLAEVGRPLCRGAAPARVCGSRRWRGGPQGCAVSRGCCVRLPPSLHARRRAHTHAHACTHAHKCTHADTHTRAHANARAPWEDPRHDHKMRIALLPSQGPDPVRARTALVTGASHRVNSKPRSVPSHPRSPGTLGSHATSSSPGCRLSNLLSD